MENEELKLRVEQLPPGFRFDPSDEELVLHFLCSKSSNPNISSSLISNHHNIIPFFDDFYANYYHPSLLLGDAFESYGKWYFYTRKSENRMTEFGYWREMGMEQPVFARSTSNKLVGFKKTLVFYEGKFPFGVQTQWFMHEYHLCTDTFRGEKRREKIRAPSQDEMQPLVLCRMQQNGIDFEQLTNKFLEDDNYDENSEGELSSMDEVFLTFMNENDEITSSYTS